MLLQRAVRRWMSVGVSDAVKAAVADGRAVVALESTILTHGLPYPDSEQLAAAAEQTVRQQGALAATVGVIDGQLRVGLTGAQLADLTRRSSLGQALKCGVRDLAFYGRPNFYCGTTVSATLFAAQRSRVRVFATGGLGGVHRNAATTFDVSSDLIQLSKSPVVVVCSGVKSILDIGLTLEYLETLGVPVVTLGQKQFPGFYSADSGFLSPHYLLDEQDISSLAKLVDNHFQLGLETGILVGVPIPAEYREHSRAVANAIEQALSETEGRYHGKDITPAVLKRVRELTGGLTVTLNKALYLNNCRVAAQLAASLSWSNRHWGRSATRVEAAQAEGSKSSSGAPSDGEQSGAAPYVLCVGGAAVDVISKAAGPVQLNGGSVEGSVSVCAGGVARNIADAVARCGSSSWLISSVGGDWMGQVVRDSCQHLTKLLLLDAPTTDVHVGTAAQSGEILAYVLSRASLASFNAAAVARMKQAIANAELVCIDLNPSVDSLEAVLSACYDARVPALLEPTDFNELLKIAQLAHKCLRAIFYITPNLHELVLLNSVLLGRSPDEALSKWEGVDDEKALIEGSFTLASELVRWFPNIVVKLGRHGVLLVQTAEYQSRLPVRSNMQGAEFERRRAPPSVRMLHLPCEELVQPADIRNTSGAGDSFVGAFMHGALRGWPPSVCLRAGLVAARYSLLSSDAVAPQFNAQALAHLAPPQSSPAEQKR